METFFFRPYAMVVEDTKETKTRAGRTYHRVIMEYKPTGEPLDDWALESLLEKTDEPLTFPYNKPEPEVDPKLRGKQFKVKGLSNTQSASGYWFKWKTMGSIPEEEMKGGEFIKSPKIKEVKYIHLNPVNPKRYNLNENFEDYYPEDQIEEQEKTKAMAHRIVKASPYA